METLRRLVVAIAVLLCASTGRSPQDVSTTAVVAVTAAEAEAAKSAPPTGHQAKKGGQLPDCALDPFESDDDDDDDTTGHTDVAWPTRSQSAAPNNARSRAGLREHEVDPSHFALTTHLARGPPV